MVLAKLELHLPKLIAAKFDRLENYDFFLTSKRWRPIPNRDQIKLIYTSQNSMQTIQVILNMDSVE
jgi:hypothetical protein